VIVVIGCVLCLSAAAAARLNRHAALAQQNSEEIEGDGRTPTAIA
jgi:hypothetical protein